MSQRVLGCLCALACALVLAASAQGGLLVQRAGDNYIAFEAEDFDTNVAGLVSPWIVQADAAASGGVALRSPGGTGSPPGGGIATYALQFDSAGTYRLYFRKYAPTVGSDSMFRSPDFGLAPADPPSPHLPVSTVYAWYNDSGAPTRYVVGAGSRCQVVEGTPQPHYTTDEPHWVG